MERLGANSDGIYTYRGAGMSTCGPAAPRNPVQDFHSCNGD